VNNAKLKKTTVALPDDVVEFLRQRATLNISSMTSELVRVVRDRMHQERRSADRNATRTVD
jgi:hypothetical protein